MSAQLACMTSDVPAGTALRVELEGETGVVEVAVVRDDEGTLHAISDICSHGQVSLSDGEVDGCTIECWLHGSRFDLRTGAPSGPPAVAPVAVHRASVGDDGTVVVSLAPTDQPTDERNR